MEVGLSYITLGQPSTELSGGEAQQIKLATKLSKKGTRNTLYILDEPTTELHMDDVSKLTERKKNIEQLKVSEKKYRKIFEHSRIRYPGSPRRKR